MENEKMVTITNPLDQECSVIYLGVAYTVPAKGTVQVPEAAGQYWVTHIHQFLIMGEQEPVVEPVEKKSKKAKE